MKRMIPVLLLAIGVTSATQAMGQANIGFKAIGGSVSYVSPENVDGALGFGAFADLGTITPEIGLEPHIDYWSHSEEAFGAKATVRDVVVGARGKWMFEVANPKYRPFAGAGLGLHFLNVKSEVSVPGFPTMTAEGSDTKLGLDFGGGLQTALSPKVDLGVEAWYGIVSDMGQFSLRLGVSQKLGM